MAADPMTTDKNNTERLKPSEFMRQLRPEYYSDTEDQVAYRLDGPTLDHHLETISARNETHEFELFARKLCERTIAPNLRPHTGPDGGGDSKVDTETFPVSEEILRFYVGDTTAAKERWAFAFSAKKTWAQKARNDVKGIVETMRPYKRIVIVTSRYAKDKTRAKVEDELTQEYGIPVTIHDRSWILKEVIENDRKDIAYNYLRIGEVNADPMRLGPTDYSRTRQLAAIEKSLDEPEAYDGLGFQRVTDTLIAAKLSRKLEKPRAETDGRFIRAIRVADSDGTFRQKLEAQYESLWTAFWWFDDVGLLNNSYDGFADIALPSEHAVNLELLCNLFQLLINSIVHGHLTKESGRLEQRKAALVARLEAVAANTERPNNSLEARTSLLVVRMNMAMIENNRDDLKKVWDGFAGVLHDAVGLGEFEAKRAIKMIEVAGGVAGDDPAYNVLIEKLADFVAARTSETEGALILLNRAQQMSSGNRIDMIRLLGKAASGLNKKEHQESFIEALYSLALAYRSAGLVWAARAACITSVASVIIQGDKDSDIPATIFPTLKLWAWISLQLRHLPDFLYARQLLNGGFAALPLSEESKEKVQNDLNELDFALGCILLNLTTSELVRLSKLPDILNALGLFTARLAMLYTIGRLSVLRDDGSIPKGESDEDVNRFLSLLASQPLARQASGPLVLHGEGQERLLSTILGVSIELQYITSPILIVVAEIVLAALESFLATTIDQDVIPHTERFLIVIEEVAGLTVPQISVETLDMTATICWPKGVAFNELVLRGEMHQFLFETAVMVMGATCMVRDLKALLEKMHSDEAVHKRLMMVAAVPNSYHRVASRHYSTLENWQDVQGAFYDIQEPRPVLNLVEIAPPDEDEDDERTEDKFSVKSHREMEVRSVIDTHTWNQAGWMATLYFRAGESGPPGIALVFRDEVAARKIFERWRERFGPQDKDEEIYISFIRRIPMSDPNHYILVITSKRPEINDRNKGRAFLLSLRSMTMTPDSPSNLNNFLTTYGEFAGYYLVPALMKDGAPQILQELGIVKRKLNVIEASEVDVTDIEATALRQRGFEVSEQAG